MSDEMRALMWAALRLVPLLESIAGAVGSDTHEQEHVVRGDGVPGYTIEVAVRRHADGWWAVAHPLSRPFHPEGPLHCIDLLDYLPRVDGTMDDAVCALHSALIQAVNGRSDAGA